MAVFEFKTVGTAHETYLVEADDEDAARAILYGGDVEPLSSEVEGMDVESVREQS